MRILPRVESITVARFFHSDCRFRYRCRGLDYSTVRCGWFMDPTEVQSIDQGVFAFPKPTFKHGLGYVFSISAMLVAFGLFSSSLVIPDVPRVEEANVLPYLHDDMAAYEYGSLQDGYDSDEYAAQAAFVVVPLELVEGTLAYDDCQWVEDDEGGGHWDYDFSMADAQLLTMMDAEGTVIQAAFSLERSLSPEGEMDDPGCNSEWSRTIQGYGMDANNFLFNAFVLVEESPPRYQLLSVKEIGNLNNPSNDPQEVTQREDRGRWALLSTGDRWTDFHVQHLASADGQPSQDSQGEPLGGEGHKFCSGRARVWWPVVPAFRPQFPAAALRGPSCSFGERRLAVWGARAQQFQRPVRWGSGWETHS